MTRVAGQFRLENAFDPFRGQPAVVRKVWCETVEVVAGRTLLGLPASHIAELGLQGRPCGWRQMRVFDPVRLFVFDRDLLLEVDQVADNRPVCVGRLVLDYLQLVVDPTTGRVTKSQANGGEWVLDMF